MQAVLQCVPLRLSRALKSCTVNAPDMHVPHAILMGLGF